MGLALAGLLGSGCSAAPRPDAEERHRLVTSAAARQQRAQAEEAIRERVAAFAARPSLEPVFLWFSDYCTGPRLPDLFDQSEDPEVVHCRMEAIAYYGAREGVTPTLKDIGRGRLGDWGGLTGAGPDTGGVGGLRYALEYQRLKGRQADGLRLSRPELNGPSFTVEWDDPWDPAWKVEEPMPCPSPAWPDGRCLVEPAGTTVAAARARHGTVFAVHFTSEEYWTYSREEWQSAGA
ncbi:hypothetical protein AQI70_35330 [Streptomyces curacoi]|uniref:Uncharacterized protein n=1 Tax=Streptomyces curacoi TaxID=146536 RepID=A0A117NUM6_9ACTN|nr:hypothetical protein AQI70_35330 [Streptomyces curacoi]